MAHRRGITQKMTPGLPQESGSVGAQRTPRTRQPYKKDPDPHPSPAGCQLHGLDPSAGHTVTLDHMVSTPSRLP